MQPAPDSHPRLFSIPGPSAIRVTLNHAICGKLTGDLTVDEIIGGTSPYSYTLDGNAFTPGLSFKSLQPGSHTILVKDKYGCIYFRDFEIIYRPQTKIYVTPKDTTVCYDEHVPLTVSGGVNQLQNLNWNIPAQGSNAVFTASSSRRIIVTARDVNNCFVSDTSFVQAEACNPPEKCLSIPNAFTPNYDGINDVLVPIANGCRISSIHFQVYDRWGNLVFESNQMIKGWNGYYKGNPAIAGVYVYMCTFVAEDGVERQQKGTLSLIR